MELVEPALAMVCAGSEYVWRWANVLGSCKQEAHVSAMIASERRRLLIRHMASTNTSLLSPSSKFSCTTQTSPLQDDLTVPP